MATVSCGMCNRQILVADPVELAGFEADSVISANIFRSLVPGIQDPKSGDLIKCPYCGHVYDVEIRDVWRKIKKESSKYRSKNKEWDD